MHLQAIKIRGFKSFPDPIEILLEPGVAVVVGPNGSGKSNVADAIVWAAGSLSPSELRAEKPDDVLFAGAGDRPPVDHCEVELLFDNADGAGPVPFAELSVARRLTRGGEGQYLLNRAAVRRIDLVELLADLGLGSGMHSVIGQGRVEEILGASAERRRELVEEAAGLGRFKRRRHRAELKLARVAVQAERARDLEEEVRKRLRPLALQATAAERAERLARELAGVAARIAQLDLAACEERRVEVEDRRTAAELAKRRTRERLESLLAERRAAEDELADAAGRREAAMATLYRLRSACERAALRRETADALHEAVAGDLAIADAAAATRPGGSPVALERAALDAAAAARSAASERDALAERLNVARERLAALARALAERDGLPPAARALAEGGETLALATLAVEPGHERAVAAALRWRASALLAADPPSALALLERARREGLGSLTVLVGERVGDALAGVAVVAADELLASRRPAVTRDGLGYDPDRGELWFAGETAEAVLLELDARRRGLEAEADELARALADAERAATDAQEEARRAAAAFAPVERQAARAGDPARLRALAGLAARLAASLAGSLEVALRLEPRLRARVDAGARRTGELGDELRRLGAAEAELRRASTEASEQAAAIEVELARIDAEAGDARRRLEAAGAEPAEGGDREGLQERLERLQRRHEALGQVNPLAREEFERERERLQELAAQRADLEASLSELERLRDELSETVERRFVETFAAVREHFAEVAATLFPGGEGRLRLTEAEVDGEGDRTPGIEVELRPAGKRVTRLSLLSGGEKALGAISFLFALFLARPCPFYLLDEVEAALDDTNISRFVELLRRYADRAQFIVITHQKRTMEAADVLYGVTMGPDGVSQVVSRRLPQAEPAAAAG